MTNEVQRDIYGMPIVTLTSLERTAVHVPEEKDYSALMRIYELGRIRFSPRESVASLPTKYDLWANLREKTCITADFPADRREWNREKGKYVGFRRFGYGERDLFEREGWRMITPDIFYTKQNVTPEMVQASNKWFNMDKWRI